MDKETKHYLDKLFVNVATKDNLAEIRKEMATKEDLKKFSTKEDILELATKDDLKALATKYGLKELRTSIHMKVGEIFKKFKVFHDEQREQKAIICRSEKKADRDHEDLLRYVENLDHDLQAHRRDSEVHKPVHAAF